MSQRQQPLSPAGEYPNQDPYRTKKNLNEAFNEMGNVPKKQMLKMAIASAQVSLNNSPRHAARAAKFASINHLEGNPQQWVADDGETVLRIRSNNNIINPLQSIRLKQLTAIQSPKSSNGKLVLRRHFPQDFFSAVPISQHGSSMCNGSTTIQESTAYYNASQHYNNGQLQSPVSSLYQEDLEGGDNYFTRRQNHEVPPYPQSNLFYLAQQQTPYCMSPLSHQTSQYNEQYDN